MDDAGLKANILKMPLILLLTILLLSVPSVAATKLLVGTTSPVEKLILANDVDFFMTLGNHYARNQQYITAQKLYAYASSLDPASENALSKLAIIAHMNKDYGTAILALQDLTMLSPGKETYHYDLAINLVDRMRSTGNITISEIDYAVAEFEAAERLHPDYMYAKENIAFLERIKG